MFLSNFQVIRPKFETDQAQTLDWLAHAHAKAESTVGGKDILHAIQEKILHVGCKPGKIEKRGHVLEDFCHQDWEQMQIYRLHESPKGKDLSYRSKIFEAEVDRVFESYYPEAALAPNDMIHVSCTGYLSPSGAQKIVSKRNWGEQTVVTHAYHMGCYGAFPAIRMARGFLKSQGAKRQADIVHTEICGLHINPLLHATDQLVTQSLFADGFIKYSVTNRAKGLRLKIITLLEEIIPVSTEMMSWNVVDWGNQMYLGREVPVLIARHLPGYLKRLNVPKEALFAIHPGGPKILDQIQKALQLQPWQIAPSYDILRKYGNMSSATIPHVWQEILANSQIPDKTQIVSLAFGPGLSISGSLMEKQCGS